ncbi:eukaryotic translation initiation factor 3 subunit F [Conidiobolus coronatus NRRL 28638]|uniref:Eukaryotic translation initiation factor 3 subunit F n=1 Tax=Conidiobolus coronatus (strain ATCC 28846 / CBS 209.66 / NRRL 28638) TaxID=796925 RepID=A0A137PBP1_CONC2|nr:eukaryotic translation initiation factor 3 subunit F [Conidiobolus coronatus NRRL 28638]|eukprot:KXN72427.1 eukaryotic translation initiation factor 3 subunit F [Conidiobolus coronatus NRRL 28638]
MPLTNQHNILSLDLPSHSVSGSTNRSLSTSIQPVVFFSILDHYLRRPEEQQRVIGTLLGTRSDDGSHIEITSCFAVPHEENQDQVAIDMEYHRTMFELNTQVNPNEVIVGWYATGSSLNSYSAIIQDFYNNEIAPMQAIHLTLDTNLLNNQLGVETYVSSPIGISKKPENCMFLPVPCDIKLGRGERSALDMLSLAKDQPSNKINLLTDTESLIRAIQEVIQMIDRVQTYVQSVLKGEVVGNNTLGRYLMDTLAMIPKVEPKEFGKLFNSHLQDLLMVVYLSKMTQAQLAISENLQSLV